jgi:hypothetical protein
LTETSLLHLRALTTNVRSKREERYVAFNNALKCEKGMKYVVASKSPRNRFISEKTKH